uniref:Uncharacterized protein n=1 Tax=Plectus sambesii TaxID=2011161 RepID=A0A914XG16_9BILA
MPIIAEAYYHFSFKLQYRISPEDSEKSKDEDATSTIEPASEPYQESECQAAGGVCKYSDDCNSGITDAMLCPKQSKNIHCCLAPPETTTTGEPESVETGITLGIIGKTVEDLMDLRTFELHPSEGGCLWIGEAPFCSRDCPDDYDFIREHNGRCGNGWFADTCVPDSSFGKSCSTVLGSKFKKRFCCRSDSRDCTWSGRWVDTNNAIMDCKYDHTEDRCGRLTCSANHRNSTTSLIGGINCNQLEMLDYSGKATCGFIAWSDGNRWYKTNR